ncbi:MAG: glycosyltransferase [Gammaproteobacteria bacterium]|nr:glycosyltransferase [Gammaproteobacteria bacterium]
MKILHVIHSLCRGGLENGIVNLVNSLPPNEFEHSICCLDSSGEMADRMTQKIKIIEMHRKPNELKLPFRLAKIISTWEPDIIHCRNWNSWFDTVLAHRISRTSASLVWSFHGFADGDYFPFRRQVVSKLLSLFTPELFAVCKDSAERFANKSRIPVKRFNVLYNGVNTVKFQPRAKHRKTVRTKFNIPQERIFIVVVASLTPIKNHSDLIDSIHIMVNTHQLSPWVLFLGDGQLRDTLEAQINRLHLSEYIQLRGNSDNIPEYLSAADIFVLPSQLEGMSNAILEAMASGLPTVANNVGGNQEIIISGKTGYLCEHGNPGEMAKALIRLCQNKELRKCMGLAAKQRIERTFSIDAMTTAYRQFYHQIYDKNCLIRKRKRKES